MFRQNKLSIVNAYDAMVLHDAKKYIDDTKQLKVDKKQGQKKMAQILKNQIDSKQ